MTILLLQAIVVPVTLKKSMKARREADWPRSDPGNKAFVPDF
jgi:hypothetical protein